MQPKKLHYGARLRAEAARPHFVSHLGLTLFGSATQQVIRAATCPVLTVLRAGGASEA